VTACVRYGGPCLPGPDGICGECGDASKRLDGRAAGVTDPTTRDMRCPECGAMMTNHVVVTRHAAGSCDETFTGPPLAVAAAPVEKVPPVYVRDPSGSGMVADILMSTPVPRSEPSSSVSLDGSGGSEGDPWTSLPDPVEAWLIHEWPTDHDNRARGALRELLADVRRATIEAAEARVRDLWAKNYGWCACRDANGLETVCAALKGGDT
jgi:ribosomal protein S27AE